MLITLSLQAGAEFFVPYDLFHGVYYRKAVLRVYISGGVSGHLGKGAAIADYERASGRERLEDGYSKSFVKAKGKTNAMAFL